MPNDTRADERPTRRMPKILLVEDDQSVAKTIIEWLLIDKYLVEHESSGDSGYDMLRAYQTTWSSSTSTCHA